MRGTDEMVVMPRDLDSFNPNTLVPGLLLWITVSNRRNEYNMSGIGWSQNFLSVRVISFVGTNRLERSFRDPSSIDARESHTRL